MARIKVLLLNRAYISEDIKYIRYLDDDDLLLPHQAQIAKVFEEHPEVDIIYTNYNMSMPSGVVHPVSHIGNPIDDLMNLHPWSWVANLYPCQ